MLNKERQLEILKIIKANEVANVQELTKILFASEATIRRDLAELEKGGQIKRIYGGAILVIDANNQIPLYARERENNDEKHIICEKALNYIKDGYVLFIDGSSTSQVLVKYLYKFKDLTVITNGLKIAETLADMHIKTYCTGGMLINNSYVFVGSQAEAFASQYNADVCFVSCRGLDKKGKFSDASENETHLRKVFLKNSQTRIVLLTSNKIGKTYLHTLCDHTDVDYILSDKPIPNFD